tara:strand:- start:770 stop:1171 length:402 start_codon:yes stop_codon:yes gene_type:complete
MNINNPRTMSFVFGGIILLVLMSIIVIKCITSFFIGKSNKIISPKPTNVKKEDIKCKNDTTDVKKEDIKCKNDTTDVKKNNTVKKNNSPIFIEKIKHVPIEITKEMVKHVPISNCYKDLVHEHPRDYKCGPQF